MSKEITDKELKDIQLKMIEEINNFCRRYNLSFYLAYGTLIGAVRHKGYIPWDDDIDILMPRKDYERFIKEFQSNSGLGVLSYQNDKDYYLPFSKVINEKTCLKEGINYNVNIGVYIDVFPLDNIPNGKVARKIQFYKAKFFRNIINLKPLDKNKKKNPFKRLIINVAKVFTFFLKMEFLNKMINKIAIKYNTKDTNYVGNLTALAYKNREFWNKDDFKETVYMNFEGIKLPCPKGYDNILRKTYGDYMKLPPKEKQVSHHVFEAWWKE